MRPVQAVLSGVVAAACSACTGPAQSGYLWNVDLVTSQDGCAGGAADSYHEALQYVLQFDDTGTGARVGVMTQGEPVTFATGTVAGCELQYASVVWQDIRLGYHIRWKIDGQATWQTTANAGCGLQSGIDWSGTEIVEVVSSDDPDYAAGCHVDLAVTGTYQGQL